MSNLDDIFDAPKEKQEQPQPFDKAAWAEKKNAEREAVYALIDETADGVRADGGKLQTYLDVQSRFERYSVGNALLIAAQMSEATRLGDFDYWKDNNASIKKNERSMRILDPGNEYTRKDGSIGVSYNVKKVFDISQTTSKDRTKPAVARDGRLLIKALMNKSPVPISAVDELSDSSMGAFYDHDKREIYVRRGMDAADIFKCLSQELAHAELASKDYSRANVGFQAYCVSYTLCKRYGIDAANYEFKSLPANIRSMDTQEVRAELAVIRDTANEISSRMARALDRSPKQQEHER